MFPSMDYEVIECVLRSNNGAVDATIDQLLQMSIDGQGSDDSSDSDDSIPPEVSVYIVNMIAFLQWKTKAGLNAKDFFMQAWSDQWLKFLLALPKY